MARDWPDEEKIQAEREILAAGPAENELKTPPKKAANNLIRRTKQKNRRETAQAPEHEPRAAAELNPLRRRGTCEWDGVGFARCSGRDWHLGAAGGREWQTERKANGRERDIGGAMRARKVNGGWRERARSNSKKRHWSKVERGCDSNSEAAFYIPP
jgi:hypothetical protein